MPTKLSTTVSIHTVTSAINGSIIEEFHKNMKDNDSSERHQNNALKVIIAYVKYLGPLLSMTSNTKSRLQAFLIQR
jgi:hypothetical protein